MSVESEALRAAKQRAKKAEIFTEVDVALDVAHGKNYGSRQRTEAIKKANKVLGQQFRAGKLFRFGPVTFNEGLDFARMASRVAYCGADRNGDPTLPVWKTPNGDFPAIAVHDTPEELKRTGRRPANDRDDSEPWASQDIRVTRSTEREETSEPGPPVAHNPVLVLTQQRDALQARVRELEDELAHQGNGDGDGVREQVESIVLELVGEMESRVSSLEERERRREEIYAQR